LSDADRYAIETINLTKVFNDFWMRAKVRALDKLNLKVQYGEVFGLLGPNGSGKSTAIKLMLGLLFPTSGSVAVLGYHPRNQAVKRRIGYMPEESYLYRFLNAEETLDFYGRLFNLNPIVRRTRVHRLLDMVGLSPHRRRPLAEYSKGMARRIGLAQALVNDPDLLLLDEPTTGLDPVGTREMKELIRELKKRGKTVLLCSHLLADVEDVCDRIAVLYGGRLRSEGPVQELLRKTSQTQITCDALAGEALDKVEHTLAGVGARNVTLTAPVERLENYFLRVVEQARQLEPVTSGVSAGTAAAKFWEEVEVPGAKPGKVLDRLVKAAPSAPAPPTAQEEALPVPPKEAPAPRRDVLEGLVSGAKRKTSGPAAGEKPVPRSAIELAEEERQKRAKSVLDQLLKQKGGSPEK
jgi:ABC-2 type transport system ATP-binding protein